MSRSAVVIALLLAGPAVAQSSPPLETVEQPVVYGQDDRVEAAEHPDELLRTLAASSIVTLVAKPMIDASNPNEVRLRAGTLGGAPQNLCDDERFVDQPTAGFCSGTLIGPDLVLTAGHCFSAGQTGCPQVFAVFGYAMEDGQEPTVTTQDLFSCQRLVAHRESESGGRTRDFAIFQLERPAAAFAPATVADGFPQLAVGESLVMIGSPSGLPIKTDDGGTVRDPRASAGDYFLGTPDAFGGNSGSGIFRASDLALVGHLISGETDYVADGSCNRVNVCDSSCEGERMSYASPAVAAFCEVGTDELLCGTTSTCGDGYCAYDESAAGCAADCTAPSCGDGVCGVGEWGDCDQDCDIVVPASWTCADEFYGTLDGCDCNCGAYDPDCALGQEVLNCGVFETCDDAGACEEDALGCLCDDASISPAESAVSAAGYAFVLAALLVVLYRRREEEA